MKIIRRLPAALGGSHERIHPAGTPRSAQVGQAILPIFYITGKISTSETTKKLRLALMKK